MAENRGELKCVRCRLRLPVERFYKAARKQNEPECIRCTSWACAAEPDVVPPALESGHVSIEEIRGDLPEETGFGAHMRQIHRGIEETDLQALEDDESEGGAPLFGAPPSTYGSTSSVRGGSGLPGHLASEVASDASSSTGRTSYGVAAPGRAMSVVSTSTTRLPSYLGGPRAESISTATTFKEIKLAGATPYNKWDSEGKQHAGFRAATTTISSLVSESGYTESSVRAGSVGGESNFPRLNSKERYQSKFHPHQRTEKAQIQIKETRNIGFCDSDGEQDFDDDDWN